jgi:hypothetical protein
MDRPLDEGVKIKVSWCRGETLVWTLAWYFIFFNALSVNIE